MSSRSLGGRRHALSVTGGAVLVALALSACSSGGGAGAEPLPRPPRPAMLFIVRHGESWKNVTHPADMKPADEDALTPHGREQAAAIGRYLNARGAALVLAAPTGRTRETAEVIRSALGLEPVKVEDALAPLADGRDPSGKPVTFAWRVSEWKAGRDPRPQGGESLEDGQRRATTLVESLVKHGVDNWGMVVVTHGDIVAALLGRAARTPVPACWGKHEVPTGSVSEVEVGADGGWRLVKEGVVPVSEGAVPGTTPPPEAR